MFVCVRATGRPAPAALARPTSDARQEEEKDSERVHANTHEQSLANWPHQAERKKAPANLYARLAALGVFFLSWRAT